MTHHIVIIGAGHAAGAMAKNLRELGFDGTITMIGEEALPPYERPNLSKDYLADHQTKPVFVLDAAQCADHHINWHPSSRVIAVDRETKQAFLADQEPISYDKLVFATGGTPRRLPVVDHDQIYYLRDTQDAEKIRAVMKTAQKAVIVGGGVIGLEVAATLKKSGLEVALIENGPRLLGRNFSHHCAQQLEQIHQEKGVKFYYNNAIEAITPQSAGDIAIHLRDGQTLSADFIIVGIGIIPNDQIAEQAGLTVNHGIVVDQYYRSLDDADIFAIGDVATRQIDAQNHRDETWAHAQNSAAIAAHALLQHPPIDEPLPWFWTDQYDHKLQVFGTPNLADRVVMRKATRIYLKKNYLIGAECFNAPRDFAALKRQYLKTYNAHQDDCESDL